MPTCIWLELSVGNIEVSLALALVMLALSGAALLAVHALAPGRPWT
jgi:ABC-type tungstate transport system substrate-binding protein